MEGTLKPPRAYIPSQPAVKSSQPQIRDIRKIGAKVLLFSEIICMEREKFISLQPKCASGHFLRYKSHLGLTGFDSGLRWYVSTRRLLGSLHNLSQEKINWQQ